jgi:hypothetical protein
MGTRTVTTQAELHAALAEHVDIITINSPRGVWLTISHTGSATVRASGSATVRASGSATVEASGSATVEAWGSATVEASGSATVEAWGSATVEASGSATVRASGSATVEAWDSATVEAWDSATVWASDSATVEASGSATVEAWDSATVRGVGLGHRPGVGSATVRASKLGRRPGVGLGHRRGVGTRPPSEAWDSATVRASKWVAVHLFSARATVSGGVVIDVSALDLDDLATWTEYHGATVTDGTLTAYKAVGDDWQADRKGWVYAPGATVTAEDWDAKPECGGGLHLCLTPSKSRGYYSEATRYVECSIDMTEAVVVDRDKVKARSVRVVREVTIDGEPVTA